jgi:hypothetical protein
MRRDFPGPADGVVILDLDLAVRTYSKADPTGDLLLAEKKEQIGQITGGESRLYSWLKQAIGTGDLRAAWRGVHIINLEHTVPVPICEACGQPDMDADAAYDFFQTLRIKWDGSDLTHDELRRVLIGHRFNGR